MPPQESPPEPPPSLPVGVAATIAQGRAGGRAQYGALALDGAAFETAVVRVVEARWARTGQREPEGLVGAVERLKLVDLYLAQACEAGSVEAWRCFRTVYEPDLVGSLTRAGAPRSTAEDVAAAVIGDMAMPAPKGRAQTLLGTFDATGPLWAWLAAIGIRRFRREAGRRTRERPTSEPLDAGGGAPPWQGLVAEETASQLEAVLAETVAALEPGARSALAWKFRDGLSQRNIARLLGVSEPSVSRIMQSAVGRIRAAVERAVGRVDRDDVDLWAEMRAATARILERTGSDAPQAGGTDT